MKKQIITPLYGNRILIFKKVNCRKYWVGFFFTILLFANAMQAQQVKRLYLANDDHTDLMWTANEEKYDSAFVHMLDYFLDQVDATTANPDDFQTRFNCDGSYWIRAYQKYRSPRQYQRLINIIRSGHISCPLNFVVSTYGAQPTEAVFRGMYHAGQLERDNNLRFPLAVSMENQTIPLGLSSLWAGSGARYSWRGVCGCATRFTNESLAYRRNQLYNYTGLDGRSVIMKWYSRTLYNGRTLGGYAECRRGRQPLDPVGDMATVVVDLEKMCDTMSARSGHPFNVAAAFGYGWDDLSTFNAPDFVQAAKRYTNASRKIRVSNEVDFFEDVARSFPNLPSEQVSYGNEWDTYCVSMNETTAAVRRSTEKLRTAEALASVAALNGKDFTKILEPMRKQAWEAFGLYWEHDWTADGPVPQKERANWQIKLQTHIRDYVDTLQHLSREALAGQLRAAANPRFYIFNPLSWARTDIADLEYEGSPVQVIDLANGREVPSQGIKKGNKKFIRILAEDIPSVGYKVYECRKGVAKRFPVAANVDGAYLANKYCRLRIRPSGIITEWYDSLSGSRPLIKITDGKFLNDLGTKNIDAGTLVIENEGPVSVTLKAVSADPLPHTVRITVYANSPRIDIEDSIQSNFWDLKTWAFSLDLNAPTTHHEELGAILTAKKETRGGHYAAQNGRYDWQTFNHFADLSENKYGITISNLDCSFFTLGKSTPDSLWETSSQLKALAGGQTDPYTGLSKNVKDTVMMGIYRQNGQQNFRYQFALSVHQSAFDPVREMKFALEHQNPLVAAIITGNKDASTKSSYSLIRVDDPSVILWAVKPAEEGIANGLITRWWNFNSKPAQTKIHLSQPVLKAWQTSHIETNENLLKSFGGGLPVQLGAHQMNTYRLITSLIK